MSIFDKIFKRNNDDFSDDLSSIDNGQNSMGQNNMNMSFNNQPINMFAPYPQQQPQNYQIPNMIDFGNQNNFQNIPNNNVQGPNYNPQINQPLFNQNEYQPFSPQEFLPTISNQNVDIQSIKSYIEILNNKIDALNLKIDNLMSKLSLLEYLLRGRT